MGASSVCGASALRVIPAEDAALSAAHSGSGIPNFKLPSPLRQRGRPSRTATIVGLSPSGRTARASSRRCSSPSKRRATSGRQRAR
eukprot:1655353-Pyramimonas_sp.AAC.1